MEKPNYAWHSFGSAVGVFAYTVAVATLLSYGQALFGRQPGIFGPLFMLLLLIISATVTGLLVLWKPGELFLSGEKKEALELLAATLAWLVLFALLVGVYVASRS